MNSILTENLCVSYGQRKILKDTSVTFPKGKIVTVLGPNGCGKSTLLKTIAALKDKDSGKIYIDGKSSDEMTTKEISCRIAFLLQKNMCPPDFTVGQLLRFSRIPYKKWFEGTDGEDERLIEEVMEITGTLKYREKNMASLSGGESQRVWLAMALCQDTDILFLDEPTTYLDVGYQVELLELLKSLNKYRQMTVVMVLHDINQASLYSDFIYVMKEGRIICNGEPEEVINTDMMKEVYGIDCHILNHLGRPYVIPYAGKWQGIPVNL